ncbi:MAG: hypothetical protein JWO94_3080 [Verrucomicrobiaceae bacterium]|nr:hypothetical protein [Verrucomicrobiaceae bacterium]
MKAIFTALLLGLSSLALADDAKLDVDGLSFTVPSGWKSVEPSSAMRKAVLQVTVAGQDKPLEAVFFHFGGGDVDTNVQRWKGQLSGTVEVNSESAEVAGKKITLFTGTGTYTDPFGGLGPQENFALIGALIPMEGSGPVVIKLAGPKEATLGLVEALKKLAASPFVK